ncbi:GTPase [Clostridium algidicarnis]|uniref:GTPase n=1 Tax=Clostridium algidicarnis TaxID=37659 RepID=UPI0016292797|nr:GTPase domain-containing protein [Clostridium algidicarnis]
MSNIVETNVLIIGKSGVGKSSLLNYIFGKELMKTGTGRPVTEKGIFTEKLRINDEFVVNISDTWGIEANKAKEWEKLIRDEVKKHDCNEISAWFHTIFFCISARSARVEEFEKTIIKSLVDDGNKVIVILTHSDANDIDIAIEEMNKELEKIGVQRNSIIKVCSIGKRLLGGRTTQTFGREETIYCIKNNLWETICNKLPNIFDKMIDVSIDSWYYKCCEHIEEEVTWYNCQSNNKLGKIGSHIKLLLDDKLIDLKLKMRAKYDEAYDYYASLSTRYQIMIIERPENINFKYSFNFKIDIIERIEENIAIFVVNLIPLGIFFSGVALRDLRKDKIKDNLESCRKEISKELKDKCKEHIEGMRNYNLDKNV